MYSLDQLRKTPDILEVKTPNLFESMAQPMQYFVEFGRNKKTDDGRVIWSRNHYHEVNWMNHEKTVADYVEENNGSGWGLYASAFEYDTIDPYSANLRGDFFIDFDNEDDIRKAQEDALRIIQHLTISPNYKIPLNMMRVFFSGKKGIHVTIPYQCFGVTWHPNLDKVYKAMAEELKPYAPNGTLDMQVYERRRLFRLKGSRHASTGSHKVPVELKNLLAKSESDLLALAKDRHYGSNIVYEKPRIIQEAARYFKEAEAKSVVNYNKKYSNKTEESTLDFEPPCYTEMIAAGPVKYTRNAVACLLCAYWKQRGLAEQDAWDRLKEWNGGQLPVWELTTVFQSNFKGRYTYGCGKIKSVANCPATCKADCKFFKSDN